MPINAWFAEGFRPICYIGAKVYRTYDMQHFIDQGSFILFVSLDPSAAFDIIDYDILLKRLQTSFGISGNALAWFHSNLSSHSKFVHFHTARPSITNGTTGVPYGSMLGPIIFF